MKIKIASIARSLLACLLATGAVFANAQAPKDPVTQYSNEIAIGRACFEKTDKKIVEVIQASIRMELAITNPGDKDIFNAAMQKSNATTQALLNEGVDKPWCDARRAEFSKLIAIRLENHNKVTELAAKIKKENGAAPGTKPGASGSSGKALTSAVQPQPAVTQTQAAAPQRTCRTVTRYERRPFNENVCDYNQNGPTNCRNVTTRYDEVPYQTQECS